MSLQIIEWQDFIKQDVTFSASAMTIGVFDGLHLGHKALIERIVNRGPNPTVVTFRENPKKVVSPGTYKGDILSLRQKLAVFEQMAVKQVILIDFSLEFSKLSGGEFLDFLEDRGKMAFLAIGSNFRCGFKQDTDADFIAAMNERKKIPTDLVPQVTLPAESGNEMVSSSRIRSAIILGNIRMAASLMGRNFELDLSDMKSQGQVYDTRPMNRIVPPPGQYQVVVNPGKISSLAVIQDGKLILAIEPGYRALSLEFI